MARIPYPDEGSMSSEVRAVLDQMPRKSVTNMAAHSPPLAVSLLEMAKAQFTALELSDRDRELTILTVATLVECEYEWIHHVAISEAVGLNAAAREAIRSRDFAAEALSARDHLIIKFVNEIVDKPRVPDERFAEVSETFSSREIVELIRVAGFYWSIGRFCTVLDIEIDEPDGLDSLKAVSQLDIP
ncbi:MAG TPA: carboxymuconolactone decarboxylase family protein [Pseudonocardia sp.]|jgi:alkylhydroperoxidase family enzyme|uniref:carboxymuconolactone decarboxylase family protein n=1 Tax=Pseudonocardia sp. TaxID=60912 RepID=UPI002C852837|nr:carboxymuconolactone decarboxylase family protein [Pseudonocardia sp.]HTF54703.1 carboxymuconolactone decarboxylase family protein [Pseudonocardia sp.]